jgi:hypothetical protein
MYTLHQEVAWVSMVRKQVYFRPDQERGIRARARRGGKSAAEIVREAVDQYLEGGEQDDPEALWAKHLAWIRQRAAAYPGGHGKRTWTRDELYERGPR